MITTTRNGTTREICGARLQRREWPWPLFCDGEPYHLPPTPNGPVVHAAHDVGGGQLAAWTEER